jgi:hypothetical protein
LANQCRAWLTWAIASEEAETGASAERAKIAQLKAQG